MNKWFPYDWRYFWKNFPHMFWYEPKYFFQRLLRGWSNDQLWALDYTLGEIIVKYLRLFKVSERIGYPAGILDNKVIPIENFSDGQSKEANEKWEKILEDMTYGIDYLTHYQDKDLLNSMGIKFIKDPGSKNILYDRVEGSWDEYRKKSQENYEDAKKKAHLFIEHFNDLWE